MVSALEPLSEVARHENREDWDNRHAENKDDNQWFYVLLNEELTSMLIILRIEDMKICRAIDEKEGEVWGVSFIKKKIQERVEWRSWWVWWRSCQACRTCTASLSSSLHASPCPRWAMLWGPSLPSSPVGSTGTTSTVISPTTRSLHIQTFWNKTAHIYAICMPNVGNNPLYVWRF